MEKFPPPVTPGNKIYQARKERNREVLFTARIGVYLRLLIVAVELAAYFFYGSSALLADALSSMLDIVSAILLILFIKFADRPPDSNHPFGHGRFEPLGGLQLGVLLVVVGCGVIFQQVVSVHGSEGPALHPGLWFIPFLALVSLELCYRYIMKAAKKNNSSALVAEAYHFRVDSLTSLLATVALVFAAYFPEWSHIADHLGAVGIGLFMLIVGALAIKSNMNQLMDRVPEASFFTRVKEAAMGVEGVLGTEKIRIQHYGPDAHVDIDIEVDPKMEVAKAHEISQQVRAAIQTAWPAVLDVTVHIEPYYENDH